MFTPDDPAFLEVRARTKGLLFDLDGTLMDTDDAFIETWAARLERWSQGLAGDDPRPLLRRVLLAAEGPINTVVSLLDLLGLDDNVFSLGDRLRRVRGLQTQGRFVAVDGVLETVRSLHPSYRIGVVTSRSRVDAQAFLRQFELERFVEAVTTREDTWRLKPHPEPIRHTVSSLGLLPSQCVMVGDTAVDMVSAKAAGTFAVGVLCGFGERKDLLEAGADLILEKTADLVLWF
jgi:phosphoglycolate phosphatase-like HAD superfamily hydrolase